MGDTYTRIILAIPIIETLHSTMVLWTLWVNHLKIPKLFLRAIFNLDLYPKP